MRLPFLSGSDGCDSHEHQTVRYYSTDGFVTRKYPDRPWFGTVRRVPDGADTEDTVKLGMDITLPSFGVIFLNPPEEAKLDAELRGVLEPEYDHVLTGTFDITLPAEVSSVKYKAIRIGVESISKLNMGPGRGMEEDELFRKEMTYDNNADDTIECGMTIAFSLILPSSLPVEDHNRQSRILTSLYAVIEGSQPQGCSSSSMSMSKLFGSTSANGRFGSLTLKSSGPDGRPAGVRHPHPESNPGAFKARTDDRPSCSPRCRVQLVGERVAERPLRLVHNPDPMGGVVILNEQIKGTIPGLGSYEFALFSEIWTLASFLKSTIAITDISPGVTIYSLKVYIRQTHTITSPRDGKVVTTSSDVPVISQGVAVPLQMTHPDLKRSAMWRGTEAGGSDRDVFLMENKGRLPTDDQLRPSTPACVKTPLLVSHQLGVDVSFSVYGEDARGNKLKVPGPGQLKILRTRKDVVLPSCWLMPDVLRLPTYEPCAEIPRGNRREQEMGLWDACACCLTDEQIEETFKRFARPLADGATQTRAETLRRKAEAEGRVWMVEQFPAEDPPSCT